MKLIDATPIGINVRSTVATYANVHDELRKVYARTADAKERATKPEIFPIIPEACAAPYATAQGRSVWMCSFCRMWISPARNAEVPDTGKKPRTSEAHEKDGG